MLLARNINAGVIHPILCIASSEKRPQSDQGVVIL